MSAAVAAFVICFNERHLLCLSPLRLGMYIMANFLFVNRATLCRRQIYYECKSVSKQNDIMKFQLAIPPSFNALGSYLACVSLFEYKL